jgi:hypothetical protein
LLILYFIFKVNAISHTKWCFEFVCINYCFFFLDSSKDRAPATDGPKERPKLKLQPRSKPLEEAGQVTAGAAASIFGGARPVDTSAREREIEERLKSKKTQPHEKENRFVMLVMMYEILMR